MSEVDAATHGVGPQVTSQTHSAVRQLEDVVRVQFCELFADVARVVVVGGILARYDLLGVAQLTVSVCVEFVSKT